MKKELISNAISNIDDTYIEEAANYKSKKKVYKYILIPAAACLCFVFMTLLNPFHSSLVLSQDVAEEKKIITKIHLPKTNIEEYLSADYINPYIYYNGHYYFPYLQTSDIDLLGSYLETTISNDYKYYVESDISDGINVYSTDIYSVNGYDSDFMICMPFGDRYLILINNNDYTISYGHDIFEEKLHMQGRCESISYISHDNYINPDIEHIYRSGNIRKPPIQFLESIMNSQWFYSEDVLLDKAALYHVGYKLEDGINIRFILYEDGYVEFEGIPGACVKVNKFLLNKMIFHLKYQL